MPAKGMIYIRYIGIRYLSPPVLASANPVKPILVTRISTEYQFKKNPMPMITPKTRGIFCIVFPSVVGINHTESSLGASIDPLSDPDSVKVNANINIPKQPPKHVYIP